MQFLDILVFTVIFLTLLFYFGVQFINAFKIETYITIIEDEESLDKIHHTVNKVNQLIKSNIIAYIVTYIILSIIYFLMTFNDGILISAYAFLILMVSFIIYTKVTSDIDNELKIRLYKFYSRSTIISHIGFLIFLNSLFTMILI